LRWNYVIGYLEQIAQPSVVRFNDRSTAFKIGYASLEQLPFVCGFDTVIFLCSTIGSALTSQNA